MAASALTGIKASMAILADDRGFRRHDGACQEDAMEFHIKMTGPMPDLGAIDDAIRAVDPAALVDVDQAGDILRVATSVDSIELVSLINAAGYVVAGHQVTQLPSTCCGGCSG